MRRLLAAALAIVFVLVAAPAMAQQGFGNTNGYTVGTCGSPPLAYTASTSTQAYPGPFSVDTNGKLCVNATVSASVSGFQPSASGARATPVTVTTADSSGTLPTGAVVVVTNVGSNPMYCNVNGVAATTSDQEITSGGGWFAFTIPSGGTTLHCISTGGSTTANMVGGSGLPTGTGGGSGGGGGGVVTNAGTFAVQLTGATNNISNIAGTITLPTGASTSALQTTGNTSLGTIATNTTGAATSALQTTGNTSLATIATNTGAAIPAQSNHTTNIGAVDSISQYPTGATAITASAIGTTAATTATLAGTTGKTTYICSSSVRANATAATTVTDTITGLITATISSLLWVAPAASGLGVDEQIFSPCVPASATNTGIAVVSGAPGTGGNVTVHATGYQL